MRITRKLNMTLAAALWLAAAAGAAPSGPYVKVSLNNNPAAPAAWHNQMDGRRVDLSNSPGVMVNGYGFPAGRALVTVLYGGVKVAEGEASVSSGNFSLLLPLAAPLRDPRELEIKVGTVFSQRVPAGLRRLRGKVKRADGSAVPHPLVTSGLYRRSAFYVTVVGGEDGSFEILLPGTVQALSVFENDSSKEKLDCRSAGGGSGWPPLSVCAEPRLAVEAR